MLWTIPIDPATNTLNTDGNNFFPIILFSEIILPQLSKISYGLHAYESVKQRILANLLAILNMNTL